MTRLKALLGVATLAICLNAQPLLRRLSPAASAQPQPAYAAILSDGQSALASFGIGLAIGLAGVAISVAVPGVGAAVAVAVSGAA